MSEYDLNHDVEKVLAIEGFESQVPHGNPGGRAETASPEDPFGAELYEYFTFSFALALAAHGDQPPIAARECSQLRAFANVGAVAMQIAFIDPEWAEGYLRRSFGNLQGLAQNAEAILDVVRA